MIQIKYIKLIRNKIIVGKCRLEIDNNSAWLTNVFIYKKFRGLGYSKFLLKKAINLVLCLSRKMSMPEKYWCNRLLYL